MAGTRPAMTDSAVGVAGVVGVEAVVPRVWMSP
jgi:hypothetical protein